MPRLFTYRQLSVKISALVDNITDSNTKAGEYKIVLTLLRNKRCKAASEYEECSYMIGIIKPNVNKENNAAHPYTTRWLQSTYLQKRA